jgi:hypothetical protein
MRTVLGVIENMITKFIYGKREQRTCKNCNDSFLTIKRLTTHKCNCDKKYAKHIDVCDESPIIDDF